MFELRNDFVNRSDLCPSDKVFLKSKLTTIDFVNFGIAWIFWNDFVVHRQCK